MAFYFFFYGVDLVFLLEMSNLDVSGLENTLELISQVEETLPGEDSSEGKKELSDSFEGYPKGPYQDKAMDPYVRALMLWSLAHRFAVKEYVSEIISPPPEA